MKDYSPWISIWFEPAKTIDSVRKGNHYRSTLFLIMLVTALVTFWGDKTFHNPVVLSVMVVGYAIIIALMTLVIFWIAKLFKGKATYRDVFAVVVLGAIPDLIPSLFDSLNISVLSSILNTGFGVWGMIIFIAMLSHVEQFSKWKALIVFVIEMLIIGLGVYVFMQVSKEKHISPTERIQMLHNLQKNHKKADLDALPPLAIDGYDDVYDSSKAFQEYSQELFDLFEKNTWKRATMKTRDKQWINALTEANITQEDLDPFFDQITAMNDEGNEDNQTWNLILKEIPDNYVEFLDRRMQTLLESNVTVPLITLYTPEGKPIRDMNHSRAFFVSKIYDRIADFYDDEQGAANWALRYELKGVKACPLNPNTMYMAAYYDNNDTESIPRYEAVLKLIQVTNDLLDYETSAVYNNFGYALFNASMTNRYDEAIRYLEKSYAMDHTHVYSLASISGIYQERGEPKKAYQVLENEAIKFLEMDDASIEDLPGNYWIFARRLVGASFDAKDYNMTQYVCQKYLKIHDPKYKKCLKYLKTIDELNASTKEKPLYSVWKNYADQQAEAFAQHDGNLTDADYLKKEAYIRKNYLPKSGQADTVQGELLRAILRLRDEALRSADVDWDEGYGRFVEYLRKTLLGEGVLSGDKLERFKADLTLLSNTDDPYVEEDLYLRIRHLIVDFCMRHPRPIPRKIDPDLKL